MDSGLNHIESMYLSYSGLLEEFSEDIIRSRYAFLYKECMEFLKSQNLESGVRLGIVGLIDLDDYDFDPKKKTLIRATEGGRKVLAARRLKGRKHLSA